MTLKEGWSDCVKQRHYRHPRQGKCILAHLGYICPTGLWLILGPAAWLHMRSLTLFGVERFRSQLTVLSHHNTLFFQNGPNTSGKSLAGVGNTHHCHAAGSGEKALSLLLLYSAWKEQVFGRWQSLKISWAPMSPAGSANLKPGAEIQYMVKRKNSLLC